MDTSKPEDRVWRTAGGDGTRRGLFSGSVAVKARPARQLPADGAIQAAVVFDQVGRAFIADMAGSVHAYSAQGKRLWRTRLSGAISATPAVHNSEPRLFLGTQTGTVYALNAEDGTVVWKRDLPTRSDPRILSDVLYLRSSSAVVVSSWGGLFYTLDAQSGEERSSWPAGISPYSAASGSADGSFFCLRAIEGQGVELVGVTPDQKTVLHRFPEDKNGARRTMVAAAPVLDEENSVIYFVVNFEQKGWLHAYSLHSGTLAWSSPLPHAVQATPALRQDRVILVCDLSGALHAIGPDGGPKFAYPSGCEYLLAGAISDRNGTSFFGDPLGVVHEVDSRGVGKKVFEAPRGIQARLSFDPEGNLFVPSTDHIVYVLANHHHAQEHSG